MRWRAPLWRARRESKGAASGTAGTLSNGMAVTGDRPQGRAVAARGPPRQWRPRLLSSLLPPPPAAAKMSVEGGSPARALYRQSLLDAATPTAE